MRIPVVTACGDGRAEAALVAAYERGDHGIAVIRRCVDVADLVATAAAGTVRAAVVSADLRRLDREVLARLAAYGVAVVGLASGEPEERRLRQLGVTHVLTADATPAAVANAVTAALGTAPEPAPEPVVIEEGDGHVVAVWGPTGAPGRTTYAVTLATELAALGVATMLVDADVYGGAVSPSLGLLDDAPGLAAACRLANNGLLDVPALARTARSLSPNLLVLTGISRADRWPELRPAATRNVLALCRRIARVTVVDTAFALEQDETRRNAATLAVIEEADTVVAVGSADPVSLQRLVRGLAELATVTSQEPYVVVNRLRDGLMPGNPEREIRAALETYAGVSPHAFLPYDRTATDAAAMRGLSLTEVAPRSKLRQAIRREAERLGRRTERALAAPPT